MRTAGTGTGTGWPAGTNARRVVIGLTTVLVAGVDLGAKAWATSALRDRVIELGPLDLRLGYNSGVAFSIGADAPPWLVVAVTGAITTVVAVLAWRAATMGSRAQHVGLALVLGGAVANLVDRAGDGVVTDYLHTGWWPTFNMADVAIVTGALLLLVASLRHQPDDAAPAPGA